MSEAYCPAYISRMEDPAGARARAERGRKGPNRSPNPYTNSHRDPHPNANAAVLSLYRKYSLKANS